LLLSRANGAARHFVLYYRLLCERGRETETQGARGGQRNGERERERDGDGERERERKGWGEPESENREGVSYKERDKKRVRRG